MDSIPQQHNTTMNTSTTDVETKQESMEHTEDGTVAELAVVPTTPDSVCEVFESVSGNLHSALVIMLIIRPQNELASMILSHRPIRALSRALCVSERWQQVISGTVQLRKTLFLTPKHTVKKEYLELIRNALPDGRGKDVILHEPSPRSFLIVDLHPVLAVEHCWTTHLATYQDYSTLEKALPSAFLTQPPIARFVICHRKMRYDVDRESGVTFGDVVKEFEKLHAIHDRRTSGCGTGKPFPQRLKPHPKDWDDKAIELVSVLPPVEDGDGEEEFAKYKIFTSQKYDALICGIENWEGRMVANSLNIVQAVQVVDEQEIRYPHLRRRELAWRRRKQRGLYPGRAQDFGRCVDSFRATFEYSSYAQICIRLSVVNNANFITVSDDIRILAYRKARGNQ
jgi:hypothetical protein